jgi:subtilase family serine protease
MASVSVARRLATVPAPTVAIIAVLMVTWLVRLAGAQTTAPSSDGGSPPRRALLTQGFDENVRATLSGNTHPEAHAVHDRGPVADDFQMDHMLLQLRRPPEQEHALAQFLLQLHDPTSPDFHQWLTAQEFGARYGLAQEDLDTIVAWLQSHGLTVNTVYPSGVLIDVSGTAGQVRAAFSTAIHHLEVNGAPHVANMSDPQIPAALAPAVEGVVSLHDFRLHPMHHAHAEFTVSSHEEDIVPADLATIYNFTPLFAAGYSGQGQTIAVIEKSDVDPTDWHTFRTTFGLATAYPAGTFTTVHPPSGGTNNCSAPGPVKGDELEAILDAEWASAAAPNAAILLASCATTTTTDGTMLALQNLLQASGTPPAIISISYGLSESQLGAAGNAAFNMAYQQAVAEGVSVFVTSGDAGAALSDGGAAKEATQGINVNGLASTPYNVAVGGTDFGDTYAQTNSTYWSATNTANDGSARSYVPEIPWNDSCASVLIATFLAHSGITYGTTGFCNTATGAAFLNTRGGSGGPSGCATGAPGTSGVVSGTCAGYAKPSWQSILGNPSDGVRDLPDVSLFAGDGTWGHAYVVCDSHDAPCTGPPALWTLVGGTSIATPIMAAMQALVNQATGSRAGNPNPVYYALAAAEYGTLGNAACNATLGNGVASTCIFHDVTQGDMDVPCAFGSTGLDNCYLPSGTIGVLSTSNAVYQPAYGATTGWDFATGLGTVNAYNLARAVVSQTFPVPSLSALAPASAPAGGPAFTLTVTGAQFVPTSVVQWNGASRPTTFGSGTQLTAAIPAADIAEAGSAAVTVVNPTPGGGTSNALTFPVTPPGSSSGGGCTLSPGTTMDPTLLSLIGLMVASLGWRRRQRAASRLDTYTQPTAIPAGGGRCIRALGWQTKRSAPVRLHRTPQPTPRNPLCLQRFEAIG